jgi:hypothetical protein
MMFGDGTCSRIRGVRRLSELAERPHVYTGPMVYQRESGARYPDMLDMCIKSAVFTRC